LGAAWSFNPINWVYVPVKCAFKWAFVPRPSQVSDNVTEARTAWSGTLPGAWVGALGGLVFTNPGSYGCDGPHVQVDFYRQSVDTYPLKACDGAVASAASVCKLFLTATIIVFGAMGCIKALGSGFGWSPGGGSGA
jgi:hypothetical protein